ncbi:MAG: FosX/FosE/FosI family fosfomycin resistance thiol transferase [Deltaproteobacteria bacterium]|nr:FosX/FosE/FosI family fosfomycin resistance thiol transferase [Deltaproteobacteria bacterium]
MISGLSHLTFIVRDLDRSEAMLANVLGARRVYDSGAATFSHFRERFFLVGDIWIAIMEGESLSLPTYNHVAFKIEERDYDHCLDALRYLGLRILDDRPRVPGEARSIYFYDDDNHLFELHTGTLEERLARYGQRKQTD